MQVVRIEPETGATLFDYDAAGNLAWSAPGTGLTGGTCDRASVTASQKIIRAYDTRNRLASVTYLDGVSNTLYGYAADGALVSATNSNGGVSNTVLNRPLRDGPGYTGHQEDAATGLVYMQQRYYDLATGRFLSVDPVGVDPASGGNFNRYWYANDNPYRYTDPDGRQVVVVVGACAASPPCAAAAVTAVVALGVAAKKAGDAAANYYDHVMQSKEQGPAVPKDLVGTADSKSRQQGGRVNNGPLAPEHGGTGDAEKDFGKLTGGKSAPAPADKNYSPGTRVGENGISHRPADADAGPRIDIPANGSKPHETLHYPKPPPPPKLKDGGG